VDGLEERRAWADDRSVARSLPREAWDSAYKALLGEVVTAAPQPAMSVRVNSVHGGCWLTLPVSDPIHPRIDMVCTDERSVRIVTGIPSARPVPPAVPAGFAPLATVLVPAMATSIPASNIEGAGP
jgi:hypothetical protein